MKLREFLQHLEAELMAMAPGLAAVVVGNAAEAIVKAQGLPALDDLHVHASAAIVPTMAEVETCKPGDVAKAAKAATDAALAKSEKAKAAKKGKR